MNRVRSFLKLLPRFHRLFAVIGRGFPFLYKNPRNVPTNSLHSERPQWRLRHTVSDHAQQYRNKRRIVYVSRINEYRLSARHDTHWFIFSSGADRETGRESAAERRWTRFESFLVLRTRSAVWRIFIFAKPIIQTGRCGEGLSTVYPSVQTIRFFVPLGRGEVRKYIEESFPEQWSIIDRAGKKIIETLSTLSVDLFSFGVWSTLNTWVNGSKESLIKVTICLSFSIVNKIKRKEIDYS